MRQLILFFACIFYLNFCFSQGVPFPTYQQFGSQTTLTDFKGAARGVKGIIIGRYADTTTANLGSIDFYPGAQIITDSPLDVLWQRNHNATKWIQIASSASVQLPSVVTIITDSSIQICNVNSCDTFVVNVTAQTINVTNDSTIIVCSFGGSCDTVTINPTPIIPTGVFVDSVFLHHGILTDSLFYSKDGDTILVNVFDRNCGLISGGTVTYNSLLIFDIAPSVFVDCCTGVRYAFSGTQVTLAAAHVSLPRRDAIIVSSSGISVLTGTPAANPADPQLTPCQELLTFITIPAGATTITCATPDKIPYDENTTFTVTTTSVTANPDNLVNPFHLTKAIDVGAVTTASKITLTTTAFDVSPYTTLKFYVRLKATFTNAAQITLRWFTTGGTFVSNQLSIPSGSYGFVRTTINTYQVISIPMSAFSFTNSTVTGIQIGFGASNATGLYLDYMQLGGVCFVQPEPVTLPNGFGVIQTPSGAAVSTQPNDITNFIGAGNIAITATGKTVTFNGTSTGSTVTIINDSTVQVCTAQGSCQTIVFSDVDAQNVWVINDTTLLVCNVTNTLCDTVDIPNPVFFDRAFFAPNQASLGNTDHFFNGFDLYGHGGTFIMDDDGLAIKASSLITPIQAVNNHTDLTTVKTSVFMGREVAGNGAAGLGVQLRTAIDNASSNQAVTSDFVTKLASATAGSESAEVELWAARLGTLREFLSFDGSTNVTTIGDVNDALQSVKIIIDGQGKNISIDNRGTGNTVIGDVFGAGNTTYLGVSDASELIEFRSDRAIMTNGRFQLDKGTNVASAGDVTLPTDGNLYTYTGSVTTNAIIVANWQAGSEVSFVMSGAPLFKHNTAGGAGTATLLLAGAADFQAAAGDYIQFQYDGTNWHETARKIVSTAPGVNIYNSSGTLNSGRTVSTAGFNTTWTGSNATGAMFTVNNTSTSSGSYAFAGVAAANAAAVSGTNTGTGAGIQGTSVSGSAVVGTATTGLGGAFSVNPSSTSTVANIIEITRTSSGTAANGIGGRIQFTVENESGGTRLAAALDAIFTEITDATRMSDFAISTVNSGTTTESVRFIGQGAMKLRSITATAASAITAADGMIVYVSTTDGTFLTVGFWARENGVWVKL